MMYGFGETKDPLPESVAYLETVGRRKAAALLPSRSSHLPDFPNFFPGSPVLSRMTALVAKCVESHGCFSGGQAKAKVAAEDLLFEIRKDKRKHRRCRELLRLNEEIKQAKKSYEKPEMLEDEK